MPEVVDIPPRILDILVGYGVRTEPGSLLWEAFCLGRGLDPAGKYKITVESGKIEQVPAEPPTPIADQLPSRGH